MHQKHTLLLPPGYDWREQIAAFVERNGFAGIRELEPIAGCRRFQAIKKAKRPKKKAKQALAQALPDSPMARDKTRAAR